MKMFCPHCGVKGSADDSYIGRMVRCPKCKETFRCWTDQETAEVSGVEEPILPIADEPLVSPPVAEISPAESVEEAAAESPGLSSPDGEEPADGLQLIIGIFNPIFLLLQKESHRLMYRLD